MNRKRKILAATGAILLALLYTAFGPGGLTDVANQTARLHLRLFGESIYECHTRTGHWPTRAEDFAGTRMTMISPHWRSMLDGGTIVIVWRDDLNPDPKENSRAILAYYNTGLISYFGRKWVCWGDLRTEYIRTNQISASLPPQKE